MDKLKIVGGKQLFGTVSVDAAKNAVLPIIAATVLCDGDISIKKCPRFSDVDAMLEIVRSLGGRAARDGDGVIINTNGINPISVDCTLTGKIRSSFFILGPILSKHRYACVSYPGGCEIGLRPVDIHLYGLRRLGVKIHETGDAVVCDGRDMQAGEITLDFPSVGATENIMMAAVLLKGRTVIRSAAREPEIADLADFINAMGGKIHGAGTDTIVIDGVPRLHGGEYTPIPDRIIGGTYLAACAVTGGRVRVENFRLQHSFSTVEKLMRAGCDIVAEQNAVTVSRNGKLKALSKVETLPYPGFPTDMQAQLTAMLCYAEGSSLIVENLFESRYRYTAQLAKMGAKITVRDRIAVIKGVKRLHGATVTAEDLRGGAALIIAALGAEGESTVLGIRHVDRGYEDLEKSLNALGADVTRVHKSE